MIIIPTGMNYETQRYPVVTLSLIGTNTVIWLFTFFAEISGGRDAHEWIFQYLWLTPALSYPWTYFTSMFVHADFFHIFGNMLFLFLFGACVEDLIGRLRFIIFYLVCGLVGAFAQIAISADHFYSQIPMGGASGAISGCLGMYLLLRASADIRCWYFFWWFYPRFGEFEIPAWVAVPIWFLLNLIPALLFRHSLGGVAYGDHVGGFLSGMALAGLFRWKIKPVEEAAEQSSYVLDPAKVLASVPRPAAAPITTSETPSILLHDGVNQSGPFTLTHIQAGLRDGTVSPEAVYWTDGMEQWQSVKDLSDRPM